MSSAPARLNENEVMNRLTALRQKISSSRDEIEKVIYGQRRVIDQSLITLLAGGHALFVGLPGMGKTRLVETIAHVMGLNTKRVQCTPDLMPADIIGSEIYVHDGGTFRFIEGPVFCQFLMADEINRASPRTQSALLQAMQEHKVSVGGHSYDLPKPFHVLATQNPIEQEGTYPLPEAQLDRFLLQIDITYPDLDSERKMILVTTGGEQACPQKILSPEELVEAQDLIRLMPVGEKTVDGILNITQSGRPDQTHLPSVKKYVTWGPGPRASQALMLAARAQALLDGRFAPSMDDVIKLVVPVLKHRMALNYSARSEGVTIDSIIAEMCKAYA